MRYLVKQYSDCTAVFVCYLKLQSYNKQKNGQVIIFNTISDFRSRKYDEFVRILDKTVLMVCKIVVCGNHIP